MLLYYDYYQYNDEKFFLLFDNNCLLVVDNNKVVEDYKDSGIELRRINDSIYNKELDKYFRQEKQNFEFNYSFQGTQFQQKVWLELQKIPFGETRTYSQIAANIGREDAVRAVANAIGKNPILIFIPCHRVIGKNNKLGGYRGGIKLKELLLNLEKE